MPLDVRIYGGNSDDNRANARLIASAPIMFAALQSARQYVQASRDMLAECHRHPVTMKLEPSDVCANDDALLAVIDAALSAATGELPR